MDFVVEDGTGKADATSYLSDDDLIAYAVATGADLGSGDPRASLIRATAWIDGTFGARFPGARRNGRAQGLAWPRTGATDAAGETIALSEVPAEIIRATAEAALRELASSGSLAPDEIASGVVKRERMGPMEVEYAVAEGGRSAAPAFPVIEGILGPLIGRTSAGTVRLVRA